MAGIVSFVHATLWSIRHGVTIALDIIQGLCPFPVWSANAAKYIKTCYQLLVNYRLGGDKKPVFKKFTIFVKTVLTALICDSRQNVDTLSWMVPLL